MLCFPVSVLERLKKFVTKMLDRLLAHLGDTVWSHFGGRHKLFFCFYALRTCKALHFTFGTKIAEVWLTAHHLVHNHHSSSRWLTLCLQALKPNRLGSWFMPCMSEKLWLTVKPHSGTVLPRFLFLPETVMQLLWLSGPTCGLGNQAEPYMNFSKCVPPPFMHSPACLSQFCFWLQQLMCMKCVKPWQPEYGVI